MHEKGGNKQKNNVSPNIHKNIKIKLIKHKNAYLLNMLFINIEQLRLKGY